MLRAGIIGCGFIGVEAPDSHLHAYEDCPDTELVAVCDNSVDRLDNTKFHYPITELGGFSLVLVERVLDYTDMVKSERLDIVSVCTPPETHCQIVCDIAPYVKAIYCEKPIALTLEDADKMIGTCHKHNVILQINHQRNFVVPKMRFSRGLIDTGTHAFDLLRGLFGDEKNTITVDGNFVGAKFCEVEYVDTDKHIFELDCTHNEAPMIRMGVEFLAQSLDNGWQSISSGEDGREALRMALEFKEIYERNLSDK